MLLSLALVKTILSRLMLAALFPRPVAESWTTPGGSGVLRGVPLHHTAFGWFPKPLQQRQSTLRDRKKSYLLHALHSRSSRGTKPTQSAGPSNHDLSPYLQQGDKSLSMSSIVKNSCLNLLHDMKMSIFIVGVWLVGSPDSGSFWLFLSSECQFQYAILCFAQTNMFCFN